MTYLQIIALINQWIITNGNREITAAVLNPVLRAMTDWVLSIVGVNSELNTTDKSTLVAAINEVNTNLGNININSAQVYSGLDNPNTTPPPSFSEADFYNQVDAFNTTVALYIYDGVIWRNITSSFEDKTPVNIWQIYNGVSVTVPTGFVVTRVADLNDIYNTVSGGTIVANEMPITGGVNGNVYLIDGYTT